MQLLSECRRRRQFRTELGNNPTFRGWGSEKKAGKESKKEQIGGKVAKC